jgi:transposase
MTPLYSRSKIGKRAFGKAPRNQGTNLTVVGAIAANGFRAMMAYEGGTTKLAFLQFVREALVPSLHIGDVVVMDNLIAHYADGVREAIEAVGATVLYLPPYSPELNPIEHTWSKLKAFLRRAEARTLRTLAATLGAAKAKISQSDVLGWFFELRLLGSMRLKGAIRLFSGPPGVAGRLYTGKDGREHEEATASRRDRPC